MHSKQQENLSLTVSFTVNFLNWHSVQYIFSPVSLLPKHVKIGTYDMANLLQQYCDPESGTLYSRTYKVTDMSEESLPSGFLGISRIWHMSDIRINVATNLNELYCGII